MVPRVPVRARRGPRRGSRRLGRRWPGPPRIGTLTLPGRRRRGPDRSRRPHHRTGARFGCAGLAVEHSGVIGPLWREEPDMRGASWDARLEAIVRENCPHLDDDVSLTADDLLVDLGLDSLAMAAIVVQTEETFGFVFPDDELTAETFATMGTVWEAVSRLLATAR